jgi:hypothetical protein
MAAYPLGIDVFVGVGWVIAERAGAGHDASLPAHPWATLKTVPAGTQTHQATAAARMLS